MFHLPHPFTFIRMFRAWRRESNASAYTRGYDYAMSELRKHGGIALQRLEDEADCPFDRSYFDTGVLAAVRAYHWGAEAGTSAEAFAGEANAMIRA